MRFTCALLISATALTSEAFAKSMPFQSEEYIASSAKDKSDSMWKAITADTTSDDWYSAQMATLFTESEAPTFDTPGDEMPKGSLYGYRAKLIHTVGAIAKVNFTSNNNHSYTGIFEGADFGYARLSTAIKYDPAVQNLVPGMGLKFLRDGVDSANIVALYSVDGQDTYNFFANDIKNHVPAATTAGTKALAVKFATQTEWTTEMGLSDFGRYDQSGSDAGDNLDFPYMLRFHPTGDIAFPDTYVEAFTSQLMTIPSGSVIYQVFATDKPAQLGGSETHIGDIVSTSEFTTSKWGDEHFFIRHQDFAEDLEIHPEWAQFTEKAGNSNGTRKSKCPFGFLQ